MKHLLATVAILAASTASAQQVTKPKVYDHTKTVTQSVLGAILGGLIGGTASGKDSGAAIGALGGAIVANENAKGPKVTGYRLERQCQDVTVYQDSQIEVYSHSTIRFFVDGKRYVVPFQR